MNSISSVPGAAGDLAARGVRFAPEIARAAARYRLDPKLLAAVAAQETGGPDTNAGRNILGDGGHGHGVFQIDDRYHGFARGSGAMQPQANADYAAGMLSGLLRRYGGNIHRALSAYNAGSPDAQGTVTHWRDGSRLGYADSVLRHYAALGGDPPAGASAAVPQFDSLLEMLDAESPAEQANVNALSSFAQTSSYSYRQLAGLDDNGRAVHTSDAASILTDDDGDS